MACDAVFPERKGYFLELYEEMRTWAPPGFRDWSEHEDTTGALRDWSPTVITGLLQTEDYARAVFETSPGATEEIISARLASRMQRQKRVFGREVRAWFIIDEPSLNRLDGSPEVMAAQMDHLLEVAALPNVTIQQTATRLDILFDTLRAECRRASESVAIIREIRDSWTGANLRSRTQTEATA